MFTPLNEFIPPFPLAVFNPILMLLFVQEKVVPTTFEVKLIFPEFELLQRIKLAGCNKSGTGFTVAKAVCVLPLQVKLPEVYLGVMV